MNAARRLAWMLAAMLWAAVARAGDNAQTDAENKIKATYVYKFASYVDWPPAETAAGGAPFVIGIVDADGLAEELKKLSAVHPLKNRPVQVRLLAAGAVPPGLQLLYIGQGAARRARGLLDNVAAQPVLTVTESAGLLAAGSVINLVLVDERIRFEVSLPQAEARRLKISSRLLDVAYRIEGKLP
ncbi:YfiR family protein [Pseudoduganella namucuonensis]|uniref:DUF4154 domain-containing protein n=1 Tax=Pseudoduganella namucuonensis TaxID=1035707 RepID=A0A1I7EXA1_9BURK|nr:YfiR family protein [Pseudoduganella namucuonensis]SFU28553.1 protein of unknown function [Pseudoduganella namucuonensis]